ncbi:hypothetical protein COSO111634_17230 [Corallococcus soli]
MDGPAHQGGRVQQQAHAPVAQDGGAGDAGDALEELAQRPDDPLALPLELVHRQAHHAIRVLEYDDVLPGRQATAQVEDLTQPQVRQRLAAQRQDAGRLGGALVGGDLHALLHAFDGDDVDLVAHTHGEALDDGEREGQAQGQGGAPTLLALDGHGATQRLDVPAHHVHAHAAAGQLRHGGGGGEAGLEDEAQELVVAQPLGGRDQAPLPGALAHLVPLDAPAVVGQLHDDAARVMEGPQPQVPARVLARGPPLVGGLDAVVQRVAQQVEQRVAQRIQHRGVQGGVLALQLQQGLLVLGARQVAHGAQVLAEQRPHRDHPDLHHLFLELLEERIHLPLLRERILPARAGLLRAGQELRHAPPGHGQLRGEGDDAVQALQVHPRAAPLHPGVVLDAREAGWRRSAGRLRSGMEAGALLEPRQVRPVDRAQRVHAGERRPAQVPQVVHGAQQERHPLLVHRHAPVDERLEEVLHAVRVVRHRLEAERARGALQRVRPAQDGLEQRVRGSHLERDEVLLHGGDQALGLVREDAQHLLPLRGCFRCHVPRSHRQRIHPARGGAGSGEGMSWGCFRVSRFRAEAMETQRDDGWVPGPFGSTDTRTPCPHQCEPLPWGGPTATKRTESRNQQYQQCVLKTTRPKISCTTGINR